MKQLILFISMVFYGFAIYGLVIGDRELAKFCSILGALDYITYLLYDIKDRFGKDKC